MLAYRLREMLNLSLSLTLALRLFPSPYTHPSHSPVFRICSSCSVFFLHSVFSVSWTVICSLPLPPSFLYHPFLFALSLSSFQSSTLPSNTQSLISHCYFFILFSSFSHFLHLFIPFFHSAQIVAWSGLLMSPSASLLLTVSILSH